MVYTETTATTEPLLTFVSVRAMHLGCLDPPGFQSTGVPVEAQKVAAIPGLQVDWKLNKTETH